MKSKNILGKYLLLKIKYIFLRENNVCPRCIFIFDSDQAQINSVVTLTGCILGRSRAHTVGGGGAGESPLQMHLKRVTRRIFRISK